MFPPSILSAATELLTHARALGLKISAAESCTGGLVSAALTDIPGSSDSFERGFVTYSNEAKETMLGVSPALIAADGAVSESVARAMAEGALLASLSDLSVAITGVAGPGGGTAQKPVGLVHFAAARKNGPVLQEVRRFGALTRMEIRLKSVEAALALLSKLL